MKLQQSSQEHTLVHLKNTLINNVILYTKMNRRCCNQIYWDGRSLWQDEAPVRKASNDVKPLPAVYSLSPNLYSILCACAQPNQPHTHTHRHTHTHKYTYTHTHTHTHTQIYIHTPIHTHTHTHTHTNMHHTNTHTQTLIHTHTWL